MDNLKKIEKSVSLIKEKKINQARNLLLEVLNSETENDNAWYLLSFTLPTKDRQIYALNQAVKNNPGNTKAQILLSKLENQGDHKIDAFSTDPRETNSANEEVEKKLLEIEPDFDFSTNDLTGGFIEEEENEPELPAFLASEDDTEISDDEDLLSKRILSNEKVSKTEKEVDADNSGYDDSIAELRSAANRKSDRKNIAKSKKRVKKIQKKLPESIKKRNRRMMLLFFLVVIAASTYYFYNSGLSFDDIRNEAALVATDIFRPTNTPTATSTLAPPTATLVPTSTATQRPTETPVPYGDATDIPLSVPSELTENIKDQTAAIEDQINGIRQKSNENLPNKFLVSTQYLQDLASNEFNLDSVYSNASIEGEILEMLGLIDDEYDMADHYLNSWAEPRGGIFLPEKGEIYFTGINFNSIEQYIYAQEYAQFLLYDNFQEDLYGIFPDCFEEGETCLAKKAILKGESLFIANKWVLESLSIAEQNGIANLFPKYYLIAENAPPNFAPLDISFASAYGQSFITEIFNISGLEGIDALYENLPSTTEQIIHPEKYLTDEAAIIVDDPELSAILGEEWVEGKTSNFGEWKTYLLLAQGLDPANRIDEDVAFTAAEGWGGDRLQYYKNEDTGDTILSLHWIMDTNDDLNEFESAMLDFLSKRNGDAPTDESNTYCWYTDSMECLLISSNEVVWFQAPDEIIGNQLLQEFLTN